jgi:hypothetical protein
MPNYDRSLAIKNLQGYDLAGQIGAARFLLGVSRDKDLVDVMVDYLFSAYEHDAQAAKKRQKTGKRYYKEVAELIMGGLLSAGSALGTNEKIQMSEEIISDHGDSNLRMWACRFLSSQDGSPLSLAQVESILSNNNSAPSECDAVDLSRFIWEGSEVRQNPEETLALVSLVLNTRPEMAECVKKCLGTPTYIRRPKNPKLALWAMESLIREHPSKEDAHSVRDMITYMHGNPSILMDVKEIPTSMLKALSETSKGFKGEDYNLYATEMTRLLEDRASRTENSQQAIETIEAIPSAEAIFYVNALEARDDFATGDLKKVVLYRMMSEASTESVRRAIHEISSDMVFYLQEAAQLMVDNKYMKYREEAVKALLPSVCKVPSSKGLVVEIINSLPESLRPQAVVLAAETWKIWTPSEMAHMLETESDEVSVALKKMMVEHGLGSLVPYDLERRRNRKFVPPIAHETEL